jgi:hypothetical protein
MKKLKLHSYRNFLIGLIVGVLVTSGVAYSASVNNTPEGGYLLCANTKTKAVTFPSKLSCPSGNLSLEVAGVMSNSQAAPSNGSAPKSSASAQPTNQASNPQCTLDYLLQTNIDVPTVLAGCSTKELSLIPSQADKISANPGADPVLTKRAISIITAVVVEIQKRVKG